MSSTIGANNCCAPYEFTTRLVHRCIPVILNMPGPEITDPEIVSRCFALRDAGIDVFHHLRHLPEGEVTKLDAVG